MKKLLILSILFSSVFISCNEEPDPEPEVIRAYCYFYHFIPTLGSVIWEVDDSEVPEEKLYGFQFLGSVQLETATEEIAFTVKHSGTKEVLISQLFQLEQDKYYTIVVHGSADDPSLFIREIDTSEPQPEQVKFQVLHSAPEQNSIDVYMGGSTPDKRDISDLAYLSLTDHFEVKDYDARAAIIVSVHSEEYDQDSVLISSIYNEGIVSRASYFSVLAHSTYEPFSDLTLWMYILPLE